MYRYDIEQRTPEWLILKLGKFSGSTASDLLMKDSTKGYQNLIKKLAYERITGQIIETYKSDAMIRGNELEPEAREIYEFETRNRVKLIGFIEYNDFVCCSPDGLIGDEGIIEIKCPLWSTQMDYLLDQSVPNNYFSQIQFNLLVSEREWCDFYSYHPKLDSVLIRVQRDKEKIEEIKNKLEIAKQDILNLMEKLK